MKANILLSILFISMVSLGQTYSYSEKRVLVPVQIANRNEYKTLKTYVRNYRFVIQKENKSKLSRY